MSQLSIPLTKAALFLDLDGTLVAIADRPQDVVADAQLCRLLKRLHGALDGRVAIVSGRPIADVDRIIEHAIPCVAGIHGLERRLPGGKIESVAPHPQLARVTVLLRSFIMSRPAIHLEPKTLGIAVHFRQAPSAAGKVLRVARRLARATGMTLQQGRMVVELRSPGADKGDTVKQFMAMPHFKGAVPLFVGDDVTDEDGFAAARTEDGYGVLVGDWRQTRANAQLHTVEDVRAWLSAAIATGHFVLDVKA